MTSSPYLVATAAAAIASAVIGGVYLAFSTIVMKGLDRADPADALAAMRGMNVEAPLNAAFLVLFVGSTLLALGIGIVAALRLSTPGSGYLLAGAVFGIVGFIVTGAFNVPLNDRLDALDPSALSSADALREWTAFAGPWTAWNHVRTATSLVASVLMLMGLRYRH